MVKKKERHTCKTKNLFIKKLYLKSGNNNNKISTLQQHSIIRHASKCVDIMAYSPRMK